MTKASAPDIASTTLNLASPRIGAKVVSVSDDFFAPAPRMLEEAEPVFIADKYDDHGKWMDGWESRRKRTEGHDWCVVRLGVPGKLLACDIDTIFFTGNYPPAASLEAAFVKGEPDEQTIWTEVLARVDLQGDSHHQFELATDGVYSHVRLNIYPDGGVARLRVYGEPAVDWTAKAEAGEVLNLAALELGARALAWSDAHYGDPNKVLSPEPGTNMGDGWETQRRRGPGNDWLIVRLAHPGQVERAVIDTSFFKGNYPSTGSIDAIFAPGKTTDELRAAQDWRPLLAQSTLSADASHEFQGTDILSQDAISHVRLNIFPDGGVSRFKLFGKVAQ